MFKILKNINYTPPCGGMKVASNVDIIIRNLIKFFNIDKLEISKEEFQGLWSSSKDEILISFLLDRRKLSLNEFLNKGFDFRGIKIRIR
jgi:hypothetical protein